MTKMTSPDIIIIDRLRRENLEQFFTLVRMHLSFLVEINIDDVDCSTEKPKQFRWNFHRKVKNSSTNSSQNSSVAKNYAEVNSITEDGIIRLNELIEYLSKPENVTQEGIFRRTGSLNRQQDLRQLLMQGSNLGLELGKFTVHDCASVLKGFLADLSQPLLMDQYYQLYCSLATQYPPNVESSETKLLESLQLLLLLLAPPHRSFLEKLLTLLRLVADNEASNRMSPDTLATMFTPHLLCPRKLSPETFHADSVALSPVISFMIRHCKRLFEAPTRLATDATAYFTARERRRLMSPVDLDESYTDKTAANTVYSFVDRHRTKVENETNPTDTALAQLYAHIQALPDSQHKRRLIKHFNRQNGYGTPIQIQRTGKVAGSKSFGDSIKKHIFNKGLLNKTPKKGSGSSINTIEERASKKLQVDVSCKNIMLKNLANKIANADSLDANEYDSNSSDESTLSDGALSESKKMSPKFASEPNLSVLDCNEETPKNTKRRVARMFRQKASGSKVNRKYQKKTTIIQRTPTCVSSCFDEQDSGSDNSQPGFTEDERQPCMTPKERMHKEELDVKWNYLTSTPGVCEPLFNEDSKTPYTANFRRASMSPITKSTQKLSKAMQESIMTPRSRKPLIITSELRESLPEPDLNNDTPKSNYESMSLKNDSDFVSSEEDEHLGSKCSFSFERSTHTVNTSQNHHRTQFGAPSVMDISPLHSEPTRFIISHPRPTIDVDLNTTLSTEQTLMPKFKISQEVSNPMDTKSKSLSEPFREYLLSRSVLTATPIDLSILNKSTDTDDRLSDSLMYCLDGNIPSDLTSEIGNLAFDIEPSVGPQTRSPLKNLNSISCPNRKRCASSAASIDVADVENKKHVKCKENSNEQNIELHETDL